MRPGPLFVVTLSLRSSLRLSSERLVLPRLDSQRLSRVEQPDLDVGGLLSGERGELLGALAGLLEPGIRRLLAGIGGAGHVERPPVDGHRDPRPQQRQRAGRRARAHVAPLRRPHPPGLDGQEGDVDALVQVLHAVEERRVAGEVDRGRALDDEAERLGGRGQDPAAARVTGVHRHNVDVADVQERVAARLDDRSEADLVDGAPHQRRPDHHGRFGQHLQRGRIQMIDVQVRDEHGVEAMAHGGIGQRPVASQRPGPALQGRVRENAHAVHLDQHRAVADVRDSCGLRLALRGHGRTILPVLRSTHQYPPVVDLMRAALSAAHGT